MPVMSRPLTLASAIALGLALSPAISVGQEQSTAESTAAAPTQTPASPAPEGPAAYGEAARARAEERRAALAEDRNQRYQELRASAAEVGIDLPEVPPWESAAAAMPEMPQMPEPPAMPERQGMSAEDLAAMREERRAMHEKMRGMTPEERQAMREAHWKAMRDQAADYGSPMSPEDYWAQAEQRRQEIEARLEQYRQTIRQMTEEEIEAARAVFGSGPTMPEALSAPAYPPAYAPPYPSHEGYGYGPPAGYGHPAVGPYESTPQGMARRPLMPYHGEPGFDPRFNQGPPPPPQSPAN